MNHDPQMQQIQEQLEDLKCRIEQHATKAEERFEDLNKKIEAVNAALLGSLDGRTGLITSEKATQKSLEHGRNRMDDLNGRVESLERQRQYLMGWVAGVAAVTAFAVAAAIATVKYLVAAASK